MRVAPLLIPRPSNGVWGLVPGGVQGQSPWPSFRRHLMQLTLWTYEGPPHVGAMRVAASMRGVHYVLHAPQGDTYADLLFTMIERRDTRPPVTYTTFQARDLGGDTAELFKNAAREAYERFKPDLLLVGASCTAELIQDDPGGLTRALGLPVRVVAVELPAYQKKENWGAAETFYQIARSCLGDAPARPESDGRVRANVLGPTALGFRNRDDVREVCALLEDLGVAVNVVAPLGASPADLARLGHADFNVVLYPKMAGTTAAFPGTQIRSEDGEHNPDRRWLRRNASSRRWRRWRAPIRAPCCWMPRIAGCPGTRARWMRIT